MERFAYVRADDIEHALDLLNEPGMRSRPLAGGTDLLLLARAEPKPCDRMIDITRIPALHEIRCSGDTVSIGAAATFGEVIASPLVQETAPVLVEACRTVGATQIRNMGTLGGNVANAAACADSLPALVCLGATALVAIPGDECTWPVSELIVGPNRTLIPAGGLLTSLSYEIPHPSNRSAFLKLGRRNAMAISRLTVAAMGRCDGRKITEVRLVSGAATPRVERFSAVEEWLLGQTPAPGLWAEAGRLAAEEMIRITGRRWSTEFKEPALAGMVARALAQVFDTDTAYGEAKA